MRNLFHGGIGLILGFIIGVLVSIVATMLSLVVGAGWVYTESKKPAKKIPDIDPKDVPPTSATRREPSPWETAFPGKLHNLVFDTEKEAQDVLDFLKELIGQGGKATVADFKIATGENSTFEDQKWGWTNLDGTEIQKGYSGYLIQFPLKERV